LSAFFLGFHKIRTQANTSETVVNVPALKRRILQKKNKNKKMCLKSKKEKEKEKTGLYAKKEKSVVNVPTL
jgi:hypothetical protein